MDDGFDLKEFTELEKNLLDIATREMPKETGTFLRKEGEKLRKQTLKVAEKDVEKGKKGPEKGTKYHESIKRGKVYLYRGNGGFAVRVYSSAPHAHLIEYGHRVVTGGKLDRTKGKRRKSVKYTGKVLERDGKEVFVEGKHVFEKAAKTFEPTFYKDVEKFIDDVVVKGVTK